MIAGIWELAVPGFNKNVGFRRGALVLAALGGLAAVMPVGDASAAGLFEMLFGRRAPNPAGALAPLVRAFTDPSSIVEGNERRESGPSVAYCVRLCDGHPFPVQNTASSPAQACNSFCPAAKTKVFAGSTVDSAVSSDGKRYSDLPNAFAYRKQLVADCSCNGKTPGGLARLDVKTDPTLRPGDMVATNDGLMAYKGSGKNKMAEFTPVQDRKLSQIQISPAAAQARAEAPPEPAAPRDNRRRAQTDR